MGRVIRMALSAIMAVGLSFDCLGRIVNFQEYPDLHSLSADYIYADRNSGIYTLTLYLRGSVAGDYGMTFSWAVTNNTHSSPHFTLIENHKGHTEYIGDDYRAVYQIPIDFSDVTVGEYGLLMRACTKTEEVAVITNANLNDHTLIPYTLTVRAIVADGPILDCQDSHIQVVKGVTGYVNIWLSAQGLKNGDRYDVYVDDVEDGRDIQHDPQTSRHLGEFRLDSKQSSSNGLDRARLHLPLTLSRTGERDVYFTVSNDSGSHSMMKIDATVEKDIYPGASGGVSVDYVSAVYEGDLLMRAKFSIQDRREKLLGQTYNILYNLTGKGISPNSSKWEIEHIQPAAASDVKPISTGIAEREVEVQIALPNIGTEYDIYAYVVREDGEESDHDWHTSVSVFSSPRVRLSTTSYYSSRTFEEDSLQFKGNFYISLENWPKTRWGDYSVMYPFLVPRAQSKNMIIINGGENGVIPGDGINEMELRYDHPYPYAETDWFSIYFRDGLADGMNEFRYWIVLSDTNRWDAVTNGYQDLDGALSITNRHVIFIEKGDEPLMLKNVPPQIRESRIRLLTADTARNAYDGQTINYEWPYAYLSVSPRDVASDVGSCTTRWTIVDPGHVTNVFLSATTNIFYNFRTNGTYKIGVEIRDKDMPSNRWNDKKEVTINSTFSHYMRMDVHGYDKLHKPQLNPDMISEAFGAYVALDLSDSPDVDKDVYVKMSTHGNNRMILRWLRPNADDLASGVSVETFSTNCIVLRVQPGHGKLHGDRGICIVDVEAKGMRLSSQSSAQWYLNMSAYITAEIVNADEYSAQGERYGDLFKNIESVHFKVANEPPLLILTDASGPGRWKYANRDIHDVTGSLDGYTLSFNFSILDSEMDDESGYNLSIRGFNCLSYDLVGSNIITMTYEGIKSGHGQNVVFSKSGKIKIKLPKEKTYFSEFADSQLMGYQPYDTYPSYDIYYPPTGGAIKAYNFVIKVRAQDKESEWSDEAEISIPIH